MKAFRMKIRKQKIRPKADSLMALGYSLEAVRGRTLQTPLKV